MNDLAKKLGMHSPEVLAVSRELDILIYQYHTTPCSISKEYANQQESNG